MFFLFTFLSVELCLLSFLNCISVFYFIYYIIFIVKHLEMYTIRAIWKNKLLLLLNYYYRKVALLNVSIKNIKEKSLYF